MNDFDVLITPSAPGEAPNSLATTGSSVFNDLWTALHVPCLTMPAFSGPNGLPIGLQVVGRHAQDQRLLEASQAISQTLAAYRQAA
jgi:Asp-tRNA(Asn)/Glu-tRNA(Gln) amidotransferase A subunit family amidase